MTATTPTAPSASPPPILALAKRHAAWLGPTIAVVIILGSLPFFGISLPDVLIRCCPLLLTALAVTIPARTGLVNVGGEGQFFLGALGAAVVASGLSESTPSLVAIVLIALGGMVFGALWAGLAALLKVASGVNETISTLLLNYVAALIVAYAVTGPLQDPEAANFPIGAPIPDSARLPLIGDVHVGVIVALVCAVGVSWLLARTRWGFKARAAGGNPIAALRGGLPVASLIVGALLLGGLLAGLGGALEVMGPDGRLRQGLGVGFGFLGFLASWLALHRPGWVVASVVLIASISVGGDSLQIDLSLPATSVYVVTATVLLVVLGWRGNRTGEQS
ncbi:MAG: ABC transporter permease [Solirubrobacteraceae bacterium]|nr:ABC transporter permease [Solirubrobacteraceae bacterium]